MSALRASRLGPSVVAVAVAVITGLATPVRADERVVCPNAVLAVTGGGQGATGNEIVALRVRNEGAAACYVRGRPRIEVFAADGRPVPITRHWRDARRHARWIELAGHGRSSAAAAFIWGNYCGERSGRPRLRFSLPGQHGTVPVRITRPDALAPPRCDLRGGRSFVSVVRLTRHPAALSLNKTHPRRFQ